MPYLMYLTKIVIYSKKPASLLKQVSVIVFPPRLSATPPKEGNCNNSKQSKHSHPSEGWLKAGVGHINL